MGNLQPEETWEYSYQTLYADGWETACDDVTHLDKWWPDKSDAEDAADHAYDPFLERVMRIVRRRVSQPEEINYAQADPSRNEVSDGAWAHVCGYPEGQ